MNTFFIKCSLLAILIITTTLLSSLADSRATTSPFDPQLANNNKKPGAGAGVGVGAGVGGGNYGGIGGFGVPGFDNGWSNGIFGGGYGSGYGGPSGGYSRGGVIRPTVVCKERGRCYGKKLTCPAKCFSSYSRSGKNYGAGGGGGGCTIDCKKKCVAFC